MAPPVRGTEGESSNPKKRKTRANSSASDPAVADADTETAPETALLKKAPGRSKTVPQKPTPKDTPVQVEKEATGTSSGLETPTRKQATPKVSSSGKSKGATRAPVGKTWAVYGAKHSGDYLRSLDTFDAYKIACRYFHAWLALVARGFSIDELKHIFTTCLPSFLKDADDYERKLALKEFENGYVWVEEQLVTRIKAYATTWLESATGTRYQELYKVHR